MHMPIHILDDEADLIPLVSSHLDTSVPETDNAPSTGEPPRRARLGEPSLALLIALLPDVDGCAA